MVKGSKHTSEAIERMRAKSIELGCHPPSHKGKKRSEWTKDKIRQARLGKHLSEESKEKIRIARTGKPGHPHTVESKERVSRQHKGKVLSSETRARISKSRTGIKLSPEVRATLGKKGHENPNWRGGVTSETRLFRASRKYKDWRISVLMRDNYTCVFCGESEGVIHVDHIKPFASYPELRLDIDNGRTLCWPCHRQTDTYGGKRKG